MVCTTCAAGGSMAMVIFFCIGYDVAIGYSTNPFAVILTSINNGFHFFAGIGNRHFVYQKAKLYGSPIVIGREINIISNGYDANTSVPQILQFHQSSAVPSGKSGKIFDD